MSTSSRDDFANSAEKNLGNQFKRTAPPKKEVTRADAEQAKFRYGEVVSYRVPLAFKDIVDRAAHKYDVRKTELVQYFVLKGIQALEEDKATLPISSSRNRVELPPIPDVR